MDLFALLWGPVWFVLDMIILALEFFYFYKWIHAGITETRDGVLDEFQNKETAAKVKTAMDIPDRKDLDDLKSSVQDKIKDLEDAVDSKIQDVRDAVDGIVDKVKDAVKLEAPTLDEEKISEAIASKVFGQMGAEEVAYGKEKKEAYAQVMAEYDGSQVQGQDAQVISEWLVSQGLPEGLASIAGMFGPIAAEAVLEEAVGRKQAKGMMLAFRSSRGLKKTPGTTSMRTVDATWWKK